MEMTKSKESAINEKLIELLQQNGNLTSHSVGGVTVKSIFKNESDTAPTFSESIENFFIKSRLDRTNI